MEHYKLGIDIGGTNTAYGIVNSFGNIVYSKSVPTSMHPEIKSLLLEIADDIQSKSYEVIGVGIGAPNGNTLTGKH